MPTLDRESDLLRWAVETAAPGGKLVQVEALREPSGPWRIRIDRGGDEIDVILKMRPPDWRTEVACELAALRFAGERDLAVPRLIAEDLDGALGVIGFVCRALPGESAIPVDASAERLRSAGAAAASLHRIALEPTDSLPLRMRQMPWVDFSELRRAGESPTTPLLDEVDAYLGSRPAPMGQTVFVHGDLWQGNLLFDRDRCVGMVDFEAAGAGDPGIDLGSLRWDAALLFGPNAGDHILAGWEAASGRQASHVAYWDLVAGANTPADLSGTVDSITQQGRPDLDGQTLTARRNAFLAHALERLR